LGTGFRLGTLPKLTWFRFWQEHLDWLNVALSSGVLHGAVEGFPAAWLSLPRKQLDASELEQRCTITLNVTSTALLGAALNGGPLLEIWSPSVYAAGTGVQLFVQPRRRQDGAVEYGVFLRTTSYIQHGTALCSARSALSLDFEIQCQRPGAPLSLINTQSTVTTRGMGSPAAIAAFSTADLDPYLVDGQLRLEATFILM
jgi:hypothetical protein